MVLTRREFVRQSGCVLGATAFASTIERFGLVQALAQGGTYKALVCVFLNGGNDSDNMVIPIDDYASYAAVRGSGAQVQIPQDTLLPINPPSAGAQFGFHPSLTGLHELWGGGRLAVVCNVGPLVEPTTRETYQNGTARRPLNLFSHSDQQAQWQTAISTGFSQTGWGGRMADKVSAFNPPGATFPMEVAVAGITIFTTGATPAARPLAFPPGTPFRVDGFPNPPDGNPRYQALRALLDADPEHVLVRGASATMRSAIENSQALANLPALTTPFPNTTLGNQLRQVAVLIKLNQSTLGLVRQLFFCSLGGFDLHNNQVVAGAPTTGAHANLLGQVSNAMQAFYTALDQELGLASQVTTFTLSDFARTFKPNGGVGTDHGWGAHHFVMGGAVAGGDFYGTPVILAPNGPDDTDSGGGARGRWIPTIAVDQYGATLARWFGVPAADIPAVFPNIGRFATDNLSFLG